MSGLIERLEAAEFGSRELDSSVAGQFCNDVESDDGDFWWGPFDQQATRVPDFTTSLDAALALAERTMGGVSIDLLIRDHRTLCELNWPSNTVHSSAKTPALALCIAILKAKETK